MTLGEFAILVVVIAVVAVLCIQSSLGNLHATNQKILQQLEEIDSAIDYIALAIDSIDSSVTPIAEPPSEPDHHA